MQNKHFAFKHAAPPSTLSSFLSISALDCILSHFQSACCHWNTLHVVISHRVDTSDLNRISVQCELETALCLFTTMQVSGVHCVTQNIPAPTRIEENYPQREHSMPPSTVKEQ